MATLQSSLEALHSISSSSFLVASATIFIFLLLLLFQLLSKKASNPKSHAKLNLPPGPSKLPFIGNLHQLAGNSPHLSLQRLSRKFGPIFYLQIGQIPSVIVSSARLAKEMMTNHDLAISSRPQLYSAKYLFYNRTDVVFSPYGAYWRHIRKICILELLSNKRVQSFSFIREEEVVHLVHRVAQSYPGTTNLSKILGLFANDVLCRAAFGRAFSEGGEYDQHGFQKMLAEFQVLIGGFNVGEYFPSMEWINTLTGMKSRLLHTSRGFDNLFNVIIQEHLNPNRVKEDHDDLVDVLLNLQKSGSLDLALTMDNIKAVILDMFSAGTDTTFTTLDWGMTELLMNPKVMGKAQTEVRSIMEERTTVLHSDLPQMPYLKAVIKEIFRLHPPAPVLVPRESTEDVVIDGYDIPFGAGRRICPGITFSIPSVELALAQLLHSFDWKLPPAGLHHCILCH